MLPQCPQLVSPLYTNVQLKLEPKAFRGMAHEVVSDGVTSGVTKEGSGRKERPSTCRAAFKQAQASCRDGSQCVRGNGLERLLKRGAAKRNSNVITPLIPEAISC